MVQSAAIGVDGNPDLKLLLSRSGNAISAFPRVITPLP